MTYFIQHGILVHTIRETIFNSSYRIARQRSIQIKEMELIPSTIPQDHVEFNFLTVEEGNSIYVNGTRILTLLLHSERPQGNPVNFHVDIKDRALKVLMAYEQGFRNLWKEMAHKDEEYRRQGMVEMFKVIASELDNAIKA